jgi:adenylylsulfate kinase
MGLPGSGKTTFAEKLKNELIIRNKTVSWYNADMVRGFYNDWDFSDEGRIRQAERMKQLSVESTEEFVISDFVAPTFKIRNLFAPDYIVFMDTIKQSRFGDTNAIFDSPNNYDLKIMNYDYSIFQISTDIISKYDSIQ